MHMSLRVLAVVMIAVVPTSAAIPFGANSNDTSDYALGSYIWNIVFLSDSGNGWTQSQINSHKSKIQGAANFWANQSRNRFVEGAQLDITVNFVNDGQPRRVGDATDSGDYADALDGIFTINPDYDPGPSTGGGGLEPPALSDLFYESEPNTTDEFLTFTPTSSSSFSATRQFNDYTREVYDANWAFTTYVRPINGRSSALVNGPYTNAHKDDSSYVYAHEAGHIFGAYDEYSTASSAYVTRRAGYLYTENTNAHWQDREQTNRNWSSSSNSIMKTNGNWNIRSGTANAIGWRDTDNDRIPDILDTFPTIEGYNDLSVPVTSDTVLTWALSVNPMESPNPFWGDYTINTLVAATFERVPVVIPLGLGLAPLESEVDTLSEDPLPLDGAWGDYEEQFQIDLGSLGLAPGDYEYLLKVTNSVGNVSEELIASRCRWRCCWWVALR